MSDFKKIFRKEGYEKYILKVATSEWINAGFKKTRQFDTITDIYLHPIKNEK